MLVDPDIENIVLANISDREAAIAYSDSMDWTKFKDLARASRREKRLRVPGKGF